jgi:hypothetical protein
MRMIIRSNSNQDSLTSKVPNKSYSGLLGWIHSMGTKPEGGCAMTTVISYFSVEMCTNKVYKKEFFLNQNYL